MFDEPELHLIRFEGADERSRERERERVAAREHVARRLASVLPLVESLEGSEGKAEAILGHLFDHVSDGGHRCGCSCHPRLPESDLHDYGQRCPCRLPAEQRRAQWAEWEAEREAFWASPEGVAIREKRRQEEDALVAWLAAHPDVVVTEYGGLAPEQWRGSVAGHTFYFRERHDQWRIELDLRPTGHFSTVWKGGDLDDDRSFEAREIEQGDVIAEGTTNAPGYGTSPVERAEFITGIIREHLARQSCELHASSSRPDLEERLGIPLSYCPACGARLATRDT